MTYSAGTAWLQVVPSFLHIDRALANDVDRMARRIDQGLQRGMSDGLRNTIRDNVRHGVDDGLREADRTSRGAGERAGRRYADGFERSVAARLAASRARRQAIEEATRRPLDRDRLDRVAGRAPTVGDHSDLDRRARLLRSIDRVAGRAPTVGDHSDLDDTAFNRAVRRLSERSRWRDRHSDSVPLEQGDLHRSIRMVAARAPRVGDSSDLALHRSIEQVAARAPHVGPSVDLSQATRDGARYGGAFSTSLRSTLAAGLRALPEVEIDANSNDVDRTVAHIRREMLELRDQHINMDVDDATALAALRRLQARLVEVSRMNPTVTVQYDVDRAGEALRNFAEQVSPSIGRRAGDRFGGGFDQNVNRRILASLRNLPDIEPNVNLTGAQAEIVRIRAQLATLSGVRIGVDMDAGTVMARLAALHEQLNRLDRDDVDIQVRTDAAAAAAELAAVAAMANRADGAVSGIGGSASASLGRLGALIAAGLSVGTIIVPAAAAAAVAIGGIATAALAAGSGIGVMILALSGVVGAVTALNKYQQDTGKTAKSLGQSQNQVANALDGVTAAEDALANARDNAAYGAKQAARAVTDAQRDVTDAQKEARRAQLDLIEAVKEAKRQDEDRILSLRGNALAQRQATLDLAEARKELDKIMTNPRATAAEREQARITFEERMLHIDELSVAGKRLQAEQDESVRKGVAGSDVVVAAQERVERTSRAVADAQQKVADAIEAQTRQQVQGQQQIQQATRSLTQAQRSLAQAYRGSDVAGGTALNNLKTAMDQLTPVGARFAQFIFSLKDEFLALRAAAETGLLPGLQAAIQDLLPYFPALERFVHRVAGALGSMAVYAVKSLQHPVWRSFFSFIGQTAVPALKGMVMFSESVARGMAALIMALSPFNRSMGAGLLSMAEGFAVWAEKLDQSKGYNKFLDYVKQTGPGVIHLLGQLADFIQRSVIAAAPIGAKVLGAFEGLFGILNAIPIPLVTRFAEAVGLLSAAFLLNAAYAGLATRATALWASVTTIAGTATRLLSGATTLLTTATFAASFSQGFLARAFVATAGAASTATTAITATAGALGALTVAAGAAIVGGLWIWNSFQDNKDAAKELGKGLGELGEEYRRNGKVSKQYVDQLASSNPKLRQLLQDFDKLGVSAEDFAKAASGSSEGMDKVTKAIDARIATLQEEMQSSEHFWDIFGNEDRDNEISRLTHLKDELKSVAAAGREAGGAGDNFRNGANDAALSADEYAKKVRDAIAAARGFTTEQQELVDAFATIGSATADATEKADAFMKAYDLLFGAVQRQTDANVNYSKSLLDMQESVQENGRSLDIHTRAGLANHEALVAMLRATVELSAADVAQGVPLEQVTENHRRRIVELEKEAKKLGLNTDETKNLIAQYGQIPTDVQTDFATDPNGVKAVKDAFRDILKDVEYLLKYGYLPARPTGDSNQAAPGQSGAGRRFAAEGGLMRGPGTRTSDSIPAMLSDFEYVEPADSVDYYGVGLFDALREKKIPREQVGGWYREATIGRYAAGGLVRPRRQFPGILPMQRPGIQNGPTFENIIAFNFGAIATDVIRKKVIDEAMSRLGIGGPMGTGNGRGWQWQIAVLRQAFPGLALLSGFRPNSMTLTGNRSYHADGRAVDVPPRRDVAEWIHKNYGANTKELITPWQEFNIHNGKHHIYTGAVWNQHNFAGGNAHDHWAMDDGGYLPPGWSPPIWNGTGKPEPVMTGDQWQMIRQAANREPAAPTVHNYQFADTTLTPGKLRALNDREAALARHGRAR